LPRRPGHEYLMVGRDVVLLALATGVIVDILSDAF
jgi:Ni/Co efflux regulator RcnB